MSQVTVKCVLRAIAPLITIVLFCCLPTERAFATSPCDQWQGQYITDTGVEFQGPWQTDAQAAAQDVADWCVADLSRCISCDPTRCTNFQPMAILNGFPHFILYVYYTWCAVPNDCSTQRLGNTGFNVRSNPGGCQLFVKADTNASANCHCLAVAEPINPENGDVFLTETDVKRQLSAPEFNRFYDSAVAGTGDLGPGWRHSYSRSIVSRNSGSAFLPYVASAFTSSLYDTEATACTSGFAQIKGQVSTWATASASYANGACSLSVGGTIIGTLTLYYESPPTPAPGSTSVIGYDATRDNGQMVSFMGSGSSIVAAPSITMKLQQNASGYTLTDENDNVEAYDTNGRLLSVTSRAGVEETIAYDGAGRLSTVTDSYGHQLVVSYDSTGRISQVVRQ